MRSGKIRIALLILMAMFLAVSLSAVPASTTQMRKQTLRFTIVKRTPRYVVAKWRQERVVVQKGHRTVVQHGVARFVVVRVTPRYAYLQRVPVKPARRPTPVIVNVKDYGAKGDGVTDDYTSIRRACLAAAGKTLYVPAGTYLMDTRLTMPRGVAVKGDGDASWLRGPLTVGGNDSYEALKIGRDGYSCYVGGVSGVTFSRVRFAGGGGSYEGTWPFWNSHVITVEGDVHDVLFDNCEIERNAGTENSNHSLHYDNVFISSRVKAGDPVIHDVLFRGTHFGVSNGTAIGCPRMQVEIFEDYAAKSRVHGFRNINFENCIFEAPECTSIDYSGSTLSSDNMTPNSGYSHVTGCTFKGNGAGSNPVWFNDIAVEKGAGYITATGNVFYRGAGSSFTSIDAGGHCTFSGNVIDCSSTVVNTGITHRWASHVELLSDYNTVTGNTITWTGPQPRAIGVYGDNNTVTGNTLYGGGIDDEGSGNVTTPNDIR
jgi:hypothetical protein